MRAKIHRGAEEVGGSCVELQAANGDGLILDLGLPLSAGDGLDSVVPDLLHADSSPRGVLVTHGHPDHYGLLDSLGADIPLYLGAATSRILREAGFFTPMGLAREPAGALADRQRISIGSFEVTPFLVDHSAFDSYALLVGADGRRLFYTGDLRAHGRKGGLFERMVADPPRDIDTVLLEGTTVSRRPDPAAPADEREVERRLLETCRQAPAAVLACYSPQNVDRLVSVYRAAIRSGRDLVVDLYGASVAAATGRETIPQADWERVRVFVPKSQAIAVKRSGEFRRVNEISASRVYPEELAEDPGRWVISFRTSMARELGDGGALVGAVAVWMMWPGYLKGVVGRRTRAEFERLGISLAVNHASGHATVADLQRLATAIGADRVVPIHTDAPEKFAGLFERVTRQPDGEWWEV